MFADTQKEARKIVIIVKKYICTCKIDLFYIMGTDLVFINSLKSWPIAATIWEKF